MGGSLFLGPLLPVRVSATSIYSAYIVDYQFRPQNINVSTGTTVVWTFLTNGTDSADHHTVTSNNQTQSGTRTFQSQLMSAGQNFNFTFYSPGKYAYFCSVHPTLMTGIVNATGPVITPPSNSGNAPRSNDGLLLYLGIGGVVAIVLIIATIVLARRRSRRPATAQSVTG